MTTSKQYDNLDRLMQITSAPSSPPAAPAPARLSFAYSYNPANQRTQAAREDGAYWVYGYDALGQVVSGKKYWSDGTAVAGQQFEYAFDDIGNRTQTKAGGDQAGANLRTAGYTANLLNQYTERQVPGAVEVVGVSFATNTVSVNGQGTYRKGEYFRQELSLDNSAGPVWQAVSVTTPSQGSSSGHVFVAQSPESMSYDNDGNLASDGRWSYTWDGENRLVRMESRTEAGPKQRLDFEYDWQGRRVRKDLAQWNDQTWDYELVSQERYVYDGWNLVGVLSANLGLRQSCLWGLDLSGSLAGAGGVGGLIALNDATQGVQFVAFDGNGNVAGLVKAADGTLSARYEYGPFGEVIRATGPMARVNPFRFSTKYQDDETDIVMYPGRPYRDGRFLTRDPAEEAGGFNLYCFAGNNPISRYDALGLWLSDVHKDMTTRWASDLRIDPTEANNIGVADIGIDEEYSVYDVNDWNWGWHFNRSRTGDSRLKHRDIELSKAQRYCSISDDPVAAAIYLGRALHPLQDVVAHGDFNRKADLPNPSLLGDGLMLWHNFISGWNSGEGGYWTAQYPDNPDLDANGPYGQPTQDVMHWVDEGGGAKIGWTEFHAGHQRIKHTEDISKQLLKDFQQFVRDHAKGCGACRKAYLGSQ